LNDFAFCGDEKMFEFVQERNNFLELMIIPFNKKKKTSWSESASELYRPSDHRFHLISEVITIVKIVKKVTPWSLVNCNAVTSQWSGTFRSCLLQEESLFAR
jgi:hypothetical protein